MKIYFDLRVQKDVFKKPQKVQTIKKYNSKYECTLKFKTSVW